MNWNCLRNAVVIALTVLTVYSVSRHVSAGQDVRNVMAETKDSVRVEQVMVAVHDAIMETTTITIRENEYG